ncbi:hypothetical protein SUGI_0141750 [Cryptomeria japonica]|nr:hypothetical protein SUGI_0141750 [Cryptomeria japonica]
MCAKGLLVSLASGKSVRWALNSNHDLMIPADYSEPDCVECFGSSLVIPPVPAPSQGRCWPLFASLCNNINPMMQCRNLTILLYIS